MITVVLIVPVLCTGVHGSTPGFVVWILNADGNDVDSGVALRTPQQEIPQDGVQSRETSLTGLASVPLHADVLVLIGHGQPDGLEVLGGLKPWPELHRAIAERQPQKTIVLACYSPSDPSSGVFGFDGRVDAEAGALIVGWYLTQLTASGREAVFPFDRVALAQESMLHPLGRYLYFIHGYWGSNGQFDHMRDSMIRQGVFDYEYDIHNVRYFDYFSSYGATTETTMNVVHWARCISDFANNLFTELLRLPAGSQVNIIAHSMGGLIVREMLRLHRTQLDIAGIHIGKVITLGTPNDGTYLANPLNNWAYILTFIAGLVFSGNLWPSPVLWSMTPGWPLVSTLNSDPMSYSSGIQWCTVSGCDTFLSYPLWFIHGDWSDPIVTVGRAHLDFAQKAYFNVNHNLLIDDPSGTTYNYVANWITAGPDSDSDNLTDDAEIYYYHTNPRNNDTDQDGLSDFAEIVTYHTDPLNPNTDGDGLTDWYEVRHGYDPLNINNPVPATLLISSVTLVGSKVSVCVNNYSPMGRVDFYMRYKTTYGSWSTYSYKGTDYTPDSGGKYSALWTYPSGYNQLEVEVMAYDSSGQWLGTDYQQCAIGGGGPPPE